VQSSLTFIAVLIVNKDNAIILSMLLNNVFSLSYEIPTFLNDSMSVQRNLVKADRCMKLLEIPSEK
jgi:hypothetical protein